MSTSSQRSWIIRFLTVGAPLVLLLLILLVGCENGVEATPIRDNWHVTDPRCRGEKGSRYRLRRAVTSNNNKYGNGQGSGSRQVWIFNGNVASCLAVTRDTTASSTGFDSQAECNRECLNVYHA